MNELQVKAGMENTSDECTIFLGMEAGHTNLVAYSIP